MARMTFALISVCSLILHTLAFSKANPSLSSKVVILGDNNFTEFLDHSKLSFVQFYAPWCGHCKKIEGDYFLAAERLDELQIELAKYDGGANREFVKSLGIKGYPSFLLFRNGVQIATYNGPRYTDDLVDFISSRALPVAFPVETMTELQSVLDKGAKLRVKSSHPSIAILGLFRPDDTHRGGSGSLEQLAHTYAAQNYLLSAELADHKSLFMISSSPEVIAHFGVSLESREGSLVALRFPPSEMDPFVRDLPADATINMITAAVSSISAPTVIPFSTTLYREMQSSFVPAIHVLVFCDQRTSPGAKCLDLIHHVAPKYRGRILFVTVPHTEAQLYKTFHLKISPIPKIVAVNMTSPDSSSRTVMNIPRAEEEDEDEDEGEEQQLVPPDLLTEELLLLFLDRFLSGSLDVTVTSEELLPREKTTLAFVPMHKVVASNFDTLCGHCKSLEPTIRSLGKYILKHSLNPPLTQQSFVSGFPSSKRGLFVGKMDGTKNDFTFPGVVIRGFPTVLLFKKHGAGASQTVEVIPFTSERAMSQLVKFLEIHGVWRLAGAARKSAQASSEEGEEGEGEEEDGAEEIDREEGRGRSEEL